MYKILVLRRRTASTEQYCGFMSVGSSINERPWLSLSLSLRQFERADDGNCLLNGEVNGRYIRMMTYIHVLCTFTTAHVCPSF